MQIKCEYCGSMIDDHLEQCPNCGAPNANVNRTVSGTPKTIEELKQWYKARNLPPYETTRFFIGEDYKGKRAFGIYQDGENFIVYKNKDDGSRAVRYSGTDEGYAVNELYMKLKSEILNQKERNAAKNSGRRAPAGISGCCSMGFYVMILICLITAFVLETPWLCALMLITAIGIPVLYLVLNNTLFKNKGGREGRNSLFKRIYFIALVVIFCFCAIVESDGTKYYKYNNKVYCDRFGTYYVMAGGVYTAIDSLPYDIEQSPDTYVFDSDDSDWNSGYSYYNANESNDSNYSNYSNTDKNDSWDNDSDYDSDYDWDSGDSWDSGGSDWGSDW